MPHALTEPWFEAHFFDRANENGGYHAGHPCYDEEPVKFSEAQGLLLWCPCGIDDPRYPLDGGRPHMALIPFANPPCGIPVPANFGPESRDGKSRPRWTVSGSGLHDLTLAPSVDAGCWHGYIQNGVVK